MSVKARRVIFLIVLGIMALSLCAFLAMLFTPLPNWLANWVVDQFLEEPLGADIHIGDVGGSLFDGLSIEDVEVRMRNGRFGAKVEAISLQYDWRQLARGSWQLHRVGIQEPVIYVMEAVESASQVAAADSSAAFTMMPTIPAFEVHHLTITAGRLESPAGLLVDSLGLTMSLRGGNHQLQVQIPRCHLVLPQRDLAVRILSADLIVSPEAIRMSRLQVQSGASRLNLSGWLSMKPALSCSLEVRADSLSLGELGLALGRGELPPGELVLTGRVQGQVGNWTGKVHIGGQAAGYDIQDLKTEFSWRGDRLELDDLSMKSPGGDLKGRGHVQTMVENPGFGVDLFLQGVDLSAFLDQVPPSQLTGRLLVSGAGLPGQTLRASVNLDLHEGVIAGRSFHSLRGQIRFDRGVWTLDQGLELDVEGAHLYLAGSLDAQRNLDAWAQVVVVDVGSLLDRPGLSGSLQAHFRALGPVTDPALAGQLRLMDLHHQGQRLQRVRGNFGLSGAVSREEGFFSLRFFDGQLGNLAIERGQALGRFAGSRVYVDSLILESPEVRMTTAAELNLIEGGLEAHVDPLRGRYRQYDFTNSGPLRFSLNDGLLHLEESELLLETGSLRVQGTVGPGSQIQGWAELRDVNMEPISGLLPLGHQLSGPVSLDVTLEGSTEAPMLKADLQWEGGSFDDMTFDQLQAELAYSGRRLKVEDFHIRREDTLLRGGGYMSLDLPRGKLLSHENWDLALTGEGNSLSFLPLLIGDVERLDGPFSLRFSAAGTPNQPQYQGFFHLQNGTLKLAAMGNSIQKLGVQAHLDGSFLVIDEFKGETPIRERNLLKRLWAKLFGSKKRGRFEAFGRINLADLAYDLVIKGKRLYVDYREEMVEAELDAHLRVRGERMPQLSGQIDLTRCLISRSFASAPKVAGPSEPPAYGLDLTIQIPKNCWVRNESANIELRGQMRVLQQEGQLSLLGDLETIRGSYFFYGQNFRIQRGQVTFDEVAEINPQLNLQAWTEVNHDRVDLTVEGRMQSPTVTLSSPSGYNEGDLIKMLTLRRSPAGLDTVGAGEMMASQAVDLFGAYLQEELNRKAGGTLGVETFKIKTGPSGGLDLKRAEITVGTYLLPQIYVEYSRSLSQESGEQVGVEYSLSKKLSLQGNRDVQGLYRLGLSFKWDY